MEHQIHFSDFPQDPKILAEINGALHALQERGIPSEEMNGACDDAIARLPPTEIVRQSAACRECRKYSSCPVPFQELDALAQIAVEELPVVTLAQTEWIADIQRLVAETNDTLAPPQALSVTHEAWGAIVTIHDPDSNLGPEGVATFAWFLSSRFGLRWIVDP